MLALSGNLALPYCASVCMSNVGWLDYRDEPSDSLLTNYINKSDLGKVQVFGLRLPLYVGCLILCSSIFWLCNMVSSLIFLNFHCICNSDCRN